MKTEEELQQYRRLRSELISISDARGVKWAMYYANLLGIGGNTPDQVFRNFFNDQSKRFNNEQLAIIYNDLEEHKDIRPFTQCEMQHEVLKIVGKIGKVIEKMQKHFDHKEEIDLDEILPLVPEVRELYSLSNLLNLRVEETRANL